MSTTLLLAASLLGACTSSATRGLRIQFFPGPADDAVQSASVEAVVRVLGRNGAALTRVAPPSLVRGLVPIECSGRTLLADLRFARSAGVQSLAVRFCRPEAPGSIACDGDDAAAAASATGQCRDRVDQVLSSIERDLADHLLGKVAIATAGSGRWWDDGSLASVLSLVSMRRWAPERDPWWPVTGHSTLIAASPLRSGGRAIALQSPHSAPNGDPPPASTSSRAVHRAPMR